MKHLSLNQILAYVHRVLNETEILKTDCHLADCNFCAKRVKTHYMLKNHFDVIWKFCVTEEHGEEMIKNHVVALISVMETLSQNPLLKINCQDAIRFIKKVFPSPILQLSPVFGVAASSEITMLSPFGKVKFPIVFEWKENPSIQKTIIKISDGEFTTEATNIELDRDTFSFLHDKEYEWEILMVNTEGILIEGPIGYCTTCSAEEEDLLREFEHEIKGLNLPAAMHQVLSGVMFETKGFYIDAIASYKNAFKSNKERELIIRIANCYEKLELKGLREEWRYRLETEINQ